MGKNNKHDHTNPGGLNVLPELVFDLSQGKSRRSRLGRTQTPMNQLPELSCDCQASPGQAREYLDRDEIITDIHRAYAEFDAYCRQLTSSESPYDPFIAYFATPMFTTRVFLRAILEGVKRFDYNEGHCRSLLVAVNSHFFTSMHMHTESALRLLCEVKALQVTSSRRRQAEELAKSLTHATSKQQKDVVRLAPGHPEFADYRDAVFKALALESQFIKETRNRFEAISVLRNKSAHSEARLSESDVKKLEQVGLTRWLVGEKLVLSPQLYLPTTTFIVDFFKACRQKLSVSEIAAAHFEEI